MHWICENLVMYAFRWLSLAKNHLSTRHVSGEILKQVIEVIKMFYSLTRRCFFPLQEGESSRHKFIGSEDIVLSNISAVYQISSEKMKRLAPSKTTASPKQILIITKVCSLICVIKLT